MIISWHDVLGSTGVILVLGLYLLLQMGKITASAPWFSTGNAIGSALILVSLAQNFNLSAFIIETAWLLISLFGLLRTLTDRSDARS